jgi:hypothetical protein
VACNTSIDQYVVLNVARTTFKDPRIGYGSSQEFSDFETLLSFPEVMAIWGEAEAELLDLFVPLARPSLFYSVVNSNNLSFMSLTYSGKVLKFEA